MRSSNPESLSCHNDLTANIQAKSIGISGLHRGENPQPGAAIIASIRRHYPNIRIVGLSYDPLESSLYSRGIDHPDIAYLMPYPGTGSEELANRLKDIIKEENIGCIIPCLDLEIAGYIAISEQLQEWGVQCVLPSNDSLHDISKLHLYDFCQSIDVPSPQTKVATDLQALKHLAEENGYPVYIKGRYYEAELVHSTPEMIDTGRRLSRQWGWPLIIQEMIAGEEYDVVGLGDGKGGIIQSCSIRKFQRTETGKGLAGIVVENPELDQMSEKIIQELQWNGPFELEFLKAPREPHALFEINPRFPAWVDFPSQIGCNLPVRLIEQVYCIEPTPLRTCTAGQMFVRHSIDLVGDISELANMANTGVRDLTANTSKTEENE